MAAKLKKTVFLKLKLGNKVGVGSRTPGYYWIRFNNVPFVAYWSNAVNEWLLAGDYEGLKDSDRVEVLSGQLLPPIGVPPIGG